MSIRRMVNELCWFDAGTAYPPVLAREALLALSAGALAAMVLLIVLAFSMERKTRNRNS